MAWTDIIPWTLDRVFGYQSANLLRENIIALQQVPYIVKSKTAPNDFLPAGTQALDALGGGYLKNNGGGVLSVEPTIPPGDVGLDNLRLDTLQFIISHYDSPGAAIATGFAGALRVPAACVITGVSMLSIDPAVTSGSIVIDIWKDTYANYPPAVADSITALAKPTIAAGIKGELTTLTGWDTALAAGDILAFNVDSVTALKRVQIDIQVLLD